MSDERLRRTFKPAAWTAIAVSFLLFSSFFLAFTHVPGEFSKYQLDHCIILVAILYDPVEMQFPKAFYSFVIIIITFILPLGLLQQLPQSRIKKWQHPEHSDLIPARPAWRGNAPVMKRCWVRCKHGHQCTSSDDKPPPQRLVHVAGSRGLLPNNNARPLI